MHTQRNSCMVCGILLASILAVSRAVRATTVLQQVEHAQVNAQARRKVSGALKQCYPWFSTTPVGGPWVTGQRPVSPQQFLAMQQLSRTHGSFMRVYHALYRSRATVVWP
jgi:hypothetical protein